MKTTPTTTTTITPMSGARSSSSSSLLLTLVVASATLWSSLGSSSSSSSSSNFLSSSAASSAASEMETPERLEGYRQRGYRWPVPGFVPDTPGWNELMESRLEQVAAIEDPSERFKGYTATMYAGLVIPNYTEHGFARTRISDSLLEELRNGISDGFSDRVNEGYTPSITGNQAWHIQRDDLTQKVDDELHDKLEEWGRTDLDLTYVYGLRLFRNTTTIKMHLDKKGSHSMGYVLHVGASDDYRSEHDPWPFVIEDFFGRTHEITMVPGDLIFFEAAKLVHGRPHPLNATWYCNVVGHYYPRDTAWSSLNHVAEAEYAVPPKWVEDAASDASDATANVVVQELQFRGGLREPNCLDGWCRSTSPDRIRWKGPSGPTTHWIDANGEAHEFKGRLRQKKEQEEKEEQAKEL